MALEQFKPKKHKMLKKQLFFISTLFPHKTFIKKKQRKMMALLRSIFITEKCTSKF